MRIGVDLGGTKIEAIVLDDDGGEHARIRIPSPQGDYTKTISAIRDVVADVSKIACNLGHICDYIAYGRDGFRVISLRTGDANPRVFATIVVQDNGFYLRSSEVDPYSHAEILGYCSQNGESRHVSFFIYILLVVRNIGIC